MRSKSYLAMALPLLVSAVLVSCDAGHSPEGDTEITVLVAYTPGVAAAHDVTALIAQAFAETNAVYRNSQTGARLVAVGPVAVSEEPTTGAEALGGLMRPDDGVMDAVHAARDRLAADVVLLVTNRPGTTAVGAVMARPETAFLVVQDIGLGAPRYGLAHEIAHLHGARHTLEEDPTLEPFPWGHAFSNDAIRTVVAGGPQRKIPYFSTPDVVVDGVVIGDAERRNVARVVRESAVYLANFRGPVRPTSFTPPGHFPTLP